MSRYTAQTQSTRTHKSRQFISTGIANKYPSSVQCVQLNSNTKIANFSCLLLITDHKTIEYQFRIEQDQNGIYQCQFTSGIKNGKGVFLWNNGNKYEGQYFEVLMLGKGKFTQNNDNIFQGMFFADKMNGYGKLTFSNGNVYEGQFLNNNACGQGRLINKTEGVYEDSFYNNLRQGQGKLKMSNYVSIQKKGKVSYTRSIYKAQSSKNLISSQKIASIIFLCKLIMNKKRDNYNQS